MRWFLERVWVRGVKVTAVGLGEEGMDGSAEGAVPTVSDGGV